MSYSGNEHNPHKMHREGKANNELKPTTPEERKEWKTYLRRPSTQLEMFAERLIADVERLEKEIVRVKCSYLKSNIDPDSYEI